MTDINQILKQHAEWIINNTKGQKADLRNVNLCNVNLCNADLYNADLRNANLRNADLRNANLRNADLSYVNLRNADLHNADLRNANLRNADLSYVNLSYANLCGADLSYAYLRDVIGFILLPIADYRGHSFAHAIKVNNIWRIRSGCRDFGIYEALDHWGNPENIYTPEDIKDQYCYAILWLIEKLDVMEKTND